jgi:hypothetical protein
MVLVGHDPGQRTTNSLLQTSQRDLDEHCKQEWLTIIDAILVGRITEGFVASERSMVTETRRQRRTTSDC